MTYGGGTVVDAVQRMVVEQQFCFVGWSWHASAGRWSSRATTLGEGDSRVDRAPLSCGRWDSTPTPVDRLARSGLDPDPGVDLRQLDEGLPGRHLQRVPSASVNWKTLLTAPLLQLPLT